MRCTNLLNSVTKHIIIQKLCFSGLLMRSSGDSITTRLLVFFDLSAAFDTIDPDKLLQILHDELGIGGVALEWFRSFLVGRTQRVKVNNEYSDSLDVPCGTPQRSVLGPPLFSINVRSQPMVFKHCKFGTSSFAYDSNGRKTFAVTFQYQIIKNDVVNCMRHYCIVEPCPLNESEP